MKFWIQKEVGVYNVEECNSIKLNSGFHNWHIFYRATIDIYFIESDVLTEKNSLYFPEFIEILEYNQNKRKLYLTYSIARPVPSYWVENGIRSVSDVCELKCMRVQYFLKDIDLVYKDL